MTITIAPLVTGIRIFRSIPEKGMRYLSVNLALADISQVLDIAKQLGLQPELVQMPMKDHTQNANERSYSNPRVTLVRTDRRNADRSR